MKSAYWYLFTLVSIPFYIGPEIAANVQINAERVLLVATLMLFFLSKKSANYLSGITTLYARNSFFMTVFTLFFLWRGMSSILAGQNVAIYLFLYEVASNFLILIVFYVAVFTKDGFDKVLIVLKWSLCIVLFFAVVEFILGINILASLAPANAGKAITASAITRTGVLRVKSVFEHPLTLGHLCVMILPILLFIDTKMLVPKLKWLGVISVTLLVIATGSRMTVALSAVIFVVYLLLAGPRLRFNGGRSGIRVGVLLLPLLIIVPLWGGGVIGGITGTGQLDSYVRRAQITNGLIAIEQKPMFGFGQGSAGLSAIADVVRSGERSLRLWNANFATVDNWYLSVLLSAGYPGLILFIMFNVSLWFIALRTRMNRTIIRRMKSNQEYGLWLGLFVSIVAGQVFMLILSIFTMQPFFYILIAAFLFYTNKNGFRSRLSAHAPHGNLVKAEGLGFGGKFDANAR